MQDRKGFELVTLANGTRSIRDLDSGETFHPVIGPQAEAEALYARQLHLRERFNVCPDTFVLWDVGLGAGANALTALRTLSNLRGRLQLVSFDRTLEALRFAVAHAGELGYFEGLRGVVEVVASGQACHTFALDHLAVTWSMHLGDFPALLRQGGSSALPSPHAIMYDAYSPMRNPDMWTLPHFERLYRHLDPGRPCALPTYSRSTILRVTLLMAGFFVGVGHATGEKEETTIAANTPDLIDAPLDRRWLDRALRSHSAEPLWTSKWRVSPLSLQSRDQLRRHPQFASR